MQENNRYEYLDVLRIIAIVFVLFNHTNGYGFFLFSTVENTGAYIISLILSIVCKCAVPIFFMVSGRLLMEREESLRIILKKRVFRFAVVLVLFSMAVYCAGNIMSGKNEFSIREVIKIVYRGTDIGTYWFLYAYVGVLLILPFIRSMRNVLTDTNMCYLFALRIVFLGILPVTIFAALGHSMGTLLKLYIVETPIFFFLSGYYFGTTEHYQKGKYRYLLLIASCVCVAISAFMTTYQFQTGGQYTEDFLDCFIPVISITLFEWIHYLTEKHKMSNTAKKGFAYVGSLVFGIYLMEPILRLMLEGIKSNIFQRHPDLLGSFLWVGIEFCVGLAFTAILKLCPGIKKLL